MDVLPLLLETISYLLVKNYRGFQTSVFSPTRKFELMLVQKMGGGQYNDHVQFNMGDLVYDPTVRGLDVFLGVVLAVCTLVGVPGNLVALKYFTSARRTVSVLPTCIYTAIASVDIFTGEYLNLLFL